MSTISLLYSSNHIRSVMSDLPVVAVVLLSSSIVGNVVLFCNEVSVSVITDADISSSVIRSPDKPYILSPVNDQNKLENQVIHKHDNFLYMGKICFLFAQFCRNILFSTQTLR